MADIRTVWDSLLLTGDWRMAGPALDDAGDLETAVILSLFTDRSAAADDRLPDGGGDRRGWWADAEAPEGPLGSRLWLLARETATEETRQRAIAYAREALAWLIEDRVAAKVDVDAEWVERGRLTLAVRIVRDDGRPLERRYEWAWRQAGS